MSSPVNPILVITNNLPEFYEELDRERDKLLARLRVIEEQQDILRRLADVVGVEVGALDGGSIL